jgi:hypothetical protein
LEGQDDPEHRIAPLVQLAQVNQTLTQKAQLRVITAIAGLVAIARDEGNGGTTVQQFNCSFCQFWGNGNVSRKPHDQGFWYREIIQPLLRSRAV